MPHVRHSIQWVCNPVPVATLKAQARGLLQQVWSRKKPLAALGADWCSSHRRGHYWKNPIGCWFRGPFYITVIRVVNYFRTTSDIGILLDPFSSLPLWSIHNILIGESCVCIYIPVPQLRTTVDGALGRLLQRLERLYRCRALRCRGLQGGLDVDVGGGGPLQRCHGAGVGLPGPGGAGGQGLGL